MKKRKSKGRYQAFLLCWVALLVTFPLLFGAIHPFVKAVLGSLLLIISSYYLIFKKKKWNIKPFFKRQTIPILLFIYLFLTIIPLPLDILTILDPVKSKNILILNSFIDEPVRFSTISYSPYITFETTFFYLALFIFFPLQIIFLKENPLAIKGIIKALMVIALLEALYGILQTLFPGLGALWLKRPTFGSTGTFIYTNHYAAFLNLCWPMVFAIALRHHIKESIRIKARLKGLTGLAYFKKRVALSGNENVLNWLVLSLIILAIFCSRSKGGIIILFFISFFLSIFLPISKKRIVFIWTSIMLIVLTYGFFSGFDIFFSDFYSMGSSSTSRLNLWYSCIPIIKDFWLTGIGLNCFEFISPIYLKYFPENIIWDHVHNEYLETIIELGIPISLLFLGWVLKKIINGLIFILNSRKTPKTLQEVNFFYIVYICAFSGILGFFVHSFMDFPWRLPANLFYLFTILTVVIESQKQILRK